MPITVICPGCESKLNAPDSAAGKKIKCPKATCGTLMIVPAAALPEPDFEVVEDDPPKPKTKPKLIAAEIDDDDNQPRSKRRRDDDDDDDRPRKKRRDDDDDDDDDARSRRKRRHDDDDDDYDFDRSRKKKRKKGGMGAGVIVAIVLGGLLVLGGVGYGIYALVGGGKAAVPKGWVEFKSDADKFKAYFPEKPETNPTSFMNDPLVESISTYGTKNMLYSQRIVGVFVLKFKPGSSAADRDKVMKKMRESFAELGGAQISQPRSVRWAGNKAEEILMKERGAGLFGTDSKKGGGAVIRYFATDTRAYVGIVASENGQPKSEEVNGFFDNFELLN